MGGERFATTMPGASELDVAACERLRAALESEIVVIGVNKAIAVTASTGMALFAPGEHGRGLPSRVKQAGGSGCNLRPEEARRRGP